MEAPFLLVNVIDRALAWFSFLCGHTIITAKRAAVTKRCQNKYFPVIAAPPSYILYIANIIKS